MSMRVGGGGRVAGGGGGDANQHTVQAGETLQGIAQQHGISEKALLKSNPQIKDQANLQPGELLNIPAHIRHSKSSQGRALTGHVAKDAFQAAQKETVLDKMIGRRGAGEAQSEKVQGGESRAFNFGAPAGKLSSGEARSEKVQGGESRAFNFGAPAGNVSPGEAQAQKIESGFAGEAATAEAAEGSMLGPDQFQIENGKVVIRDEKLKGK